MSDTLQYVAIRPEASSGSEAPLPPHDKLKCVGQVACLNLNSSPRQGELGPSQLNDVTLSLCGK
jgi:hypothetical protein